jgi:hypothetical protein
LVDQSASDCLGEFIIENPGIPAFVVNTTSRGKGIILNMLKPKNKIVKQNSICFGVPFDLKIYLKFTPQVFELDINNNKTICVQLSSEKEKDALIKSYGRLENLSNHIKLLKEEKHEEIEKKNEIKNDLRREKKLEIKTSHKKEVYKEIKQNVSEIKKELKVTKKEIISKEIEIATNLLEMVKESKNIAYYMQKAVPF